jgi:serine protease Do
MGRALVAVGVVAALAAGGWCWRAEAQSPEANTADARDLDHAKALSAAFRKAAQQMLPTVVTVHSKVKAKAVRRPARPGGANPFEGTPFEDFFDNLEDLQPQVPRGQGVGSGVIIDRSGVILTNNHVVSGADEVTIHLADGRKFKAEDIRTDEQTDLAVLRIKGAGSLPAARLGDSDKLAIGDWVIAIGAPFELDQTVSAGIISGKGRELGSVQRAKFLQTDAAINPGNSGGPLVNLEGEVIGINTAIATSNGSFQGIGFAVPVNLAKWVVPQLLGAGSVQRAYLGVSIGEIDQDMAEQLNVQPGQGVLVSEVYPNTPAAAAGLQEQDIIVRIGDQRVASPRDLQEAVERVPLDSRQKIEILRAGKPMSVDIVAKALPKDFGKLPARTRRGSAPDAADAFQAESLGIEVSDLDPTQAESLGLAGRSGVIITAVEPDTVAAEKGLQPGMLISRVGNSEVRNVGEFEKALAGQSLEKGVLLTVRTALGNRILVLKE